MPGRCHRSFRISRRNVAAQRFVKFRAATKPKSGEGWSPRIGNRVPALQRLGDAGREFEWVYVLNDEEIGLFSDEVVVNCAP